MGEDHPNMADHSGSPVESSNSVDNAVISSIQQSKFVASITPKEVAQEAARRHLSVY